MRAKRDRRTAEKPIEADVTVIGGGLAGLACASALSMSGLRVFLVESTHALGGRAGSGLDPDSGERLDVGPHIFLTEYPNLRGWLRQLGTESDIVWQERPLIELIDAGVPISMYVHRLSPPLHLLPSLAKVRTLSARDKLSNASMVWLAMRANEDTVLQLDAYNALDLLRSKGVSPRFIEWFWASACLALMNVPLERCSAGALVRMYTHLMTHRDYRIGFPARALSDLFVPGARAQIEVKGRVLLGQAAVQVLCSEGGTRGVRLEDGSEVKSKWVVAAIPPAELARLQQRSTPHLRWADCEAFEPSPYVSVYLWFAGKITRRRFWSRIWSPTDLNSDFYDLSNIRREWLTRPSVIASNIIYSHRAHALDDAQIVAATRRELAEAVPAAAHTPLVRAVVHRIAMAIPCPLPGTECKRPSARTQVPGLLLAGDWTRTSLPACMESAVRSGFTAAEHILEAFGTPRRLALPISAPQGIAGLLQRFSGPRAARV